MRKYFMLLMLLIGSAKAGQLPVTGQTNCFDASNSLSCNVDSSFARQDGGVSATQVFAKLDTGGQPLAREAEQWHCVRDAATQLVWEVKALDGGLRDKTHRYAWMDTTTSSNGGDAGGTVDSAMCGNSLNGLACTTQNYVAAVNAARLCGASDWRLPTQRELLTLLNAGSTNPAIAKEFFPNTANDVYWSADTYARIPAFAWGVHFGYGASNADYKTQGYRVRLVRGAPF